MIKMIIKSKITLIFFIFLFYAFSFETILSYKLYIYEDNKSRLHLNVMFFYECVFQF